MQRPLAAAWASAAAVVVAVAATLALDAQTLLGDDGGFVVIGLAPLACGLWVASRRPRNPVGALLAVVGLFPALDTMLLAWAEAGAAGRVAGGEVALAVEDAAVVWLLFFVPTAYLALLFPNGRVPGPRWRRVLVVIPAAGLAASAVGLFRPEALPAPFEGVEKPFATMPSMLADVLSPLSLAAVFASLVLAAAAVVVRARRARGVERVPMKWLALAALLIPATLVACLIESLLLGGLGVVTSVAVVLCLLGLPAAVTVAMLRHGLYDVDRLISRTIAWLALSALLAAAFAGVALLVAVPLGGGSAVATGVATLAVALAFTPLRRRLQRWVDRRFDRDRFRAVAEVEAFSEALREGRVEPEGIGPVLARALGDPGLELHFAPVSADPRRMVTEIVRGDTVVGVVVHDPGLAARPRMLRDVLRAAGLPVEVARLQREVRERLEEVRESRARIVRAGYEERRRLERDLHDGAQQRLVALGMSLRRVQRATGTAPGVAEAIDAAVAQVVGAVEELREIARGLRPGALDDGLGPALAELRRRTPLPMEVKALEGRLPLEVEAAAYYVVLEAVANAVKHAEASRISVQAERRNGGLHLLVSDDGCGGANARSGGGLAGLADRVSAHGGVLLLESPPGGGTSLEVTLPCA